MAIVTPAKIFVDPKEEITFLVDRVMSSERDEVIIVVPQNSLLLSSAISVKILHRHIIQSDKLAVLVTEDPYGFYLLQKAGFVVVEKVSQITSSLWENAKSAKEKARDKEIIKQKELLGNVQVKEENEGIQDSGFKDQDKEKEDTKVKRFKDSVEEGENDSVTSNQFLEKNEDEEVEEEGVETEEDEALKPYQKPRQEIKIIEIDGIQIYGGGNIEKEKEFESKYDNISEVNNLTDEDNMAEKREYMGKDFTKAVSSKKNWADFFRKFIPGGKKVEDPDDRITKVSEKDMSRRRNIILIVVLVLITLFGLAFYIVAFEMSSVDIVLNLKEQEISISDFQIVASTEVEVTDNTAAPIIIPADKLVETDTISRTATATGKGVRGEKATGEVTIFNKTTDQVKLKSGTKISSETGDVKKEYILSEDVTLKAATVAEDGTIETSEMDVNIKAVDVGEQYNISGDEEGYSEFKVNGYNYDDIQVNRYRAIEGGTSEEFTSVSKEDIEKTKKRLKEELKEELLARVTNYTAADYYDKLIQKTAEFEEIEVSSNPAQGEEAENGKFDLNLELKVTAKGVEKKELEKAINLNLQEDGIIQSEIKLDGLSDPEINIVEDSETRVLFTFSSIGTVKLGIPEDSLKQDVKGIDIKELDTYLFTLNSVEDFRVIFAPALVPEFLRRVPNEPSRIRLIIK